MKTRFKTVSLDYNGRNEDKIEGCVRLADDGVEEGKTQEGQ